MHVSMSSETEQWRILSITELTSRIDDTKNVLLELN